MFVIISFFIFSWFYWELRINFLLCEQATFCKHLDSTEHYKFHTYCSCNENNKRQTESLLLLCYMAWVEFTCLWHQVTVFLHVTNKQNVQVIVSVFSTDLTYITFHRQKVECATSVLLHLADIKHTSPVQPFFCFTSTTCVSKIYMLTSKEHTRFRTSKQKKIQTRSHNPYYIRVS